MRKDLFDLTEVNDIPTGIRNELLINKRGKEEEKIIELFKLAGRALCIDEVLVAYYRKYKKEQSRRYMTIKLYNMSRAKKPAIASVFGRKGVYELTKKQ